MGKPRVGVVGYGVIGQRLADGVALQEDMELVGVVDVAPTLSTRALCEAGMPYDLYVVEAGQKAAFDEVGIPVTGTMDDLLGKVDIVLDSSPGGVGRKNKELYQARGVKAVFQGGEKNDIVDVFFHGYANYEKGVGKDYLKLTSCNTTGLIRAVDCLDREVGVERVIVTIVRRVADPGDTHRGLVDVAQVEPVPNHQAVDLMTIMPHIEATGLLVHVPTTHGHIINVIATTKGDISKERALELFEQHPRIRNVKIADGFNSNSALFRYARDLGNKRADMYDIAVFDETIAKSGREFMFAINIPQEAVVIPETDGRHPRGAQPADRPARGRWADQPVPRARLTRGRAARHEVRHPHAGRLRLARQGRAVPRRHQRAARPGDRRAARHTRLKGCAPTVRELAEAGARVVLLAHQGGDLEYHNYASTEPHAAVMSELTGREVGFIDDVCGPAARDAVGRLADGDVLLLDNVRFCGEELTLFERKLELSPEDQAKTLVVRKLAPLADLYVCDAFAAAHRSQPTLVGFEQLLPSAMGRLFERSTRTSPACARSRRGRASSSSAAPRSRRRSR